MPAGHPARSLAHREAAPAASPPKAKAKPAPKKAKAKPAPKPADRPAEG
jgi:hypothetical protein